MNNKVYVITRGEYSDYHICAICDNEERAIEIFKQYIDCPNIEVYELNKNVGYASKHLYCIYVYKHSIEVLYDDEYGEIGIDKINEVEIVPHGYKVWVFAKGLDLAKKIASDLVTKYRAERMGL